MNKQEPRKEKNLTDLNSILGPNGMIKCHINADIGLTNIVKVCTNFDSGEMHG